MRPVVKSNKVDINGLSLTFNHWGEAKRDLEKEIGGYCSFCERVGYRSSLDVEHIFSKSLSKYSHLVYRWDNYLLGCKNCNSIKGVKDVDVSEIYLPHLNNILVAIEVIEGGAINIKEGLPIDQERKAKNFIRLVGLDRDPSHLEYSAKDDRWERRIAVWDIANEFLQDYQNQEIKLQRIIDMAHCSGFWSVWMKVFNNHPEVKKELVGQFPGTAVGCFDKDYNAIPRNGDNP